jgi:hypothetical protein
MVALQAFVDDSAADSGDRRLFLAGYINTVERWITFSNAWERERQKKPAIAYLKMSEAASCNGQFKGWPTPERDKKLLALARVIEAHHPWFVYCSVSRAEHDRILAPVSPLPLKNPYFACFWGVISLAGRCRAEFASEDSPTIDFVFDGQGGTGDQAVMWYRWLKEKEQDPIIRRSLGATPVFRNDKDVVALQAADMLAWHLRRDHEYGAENRPIKSLLMTEGAAVDIDTTALERLAKNTRRVPGVGFVQTKGAWRKTKKGIEALLAADIRPPEVSFSRMRWQVAKHRLSEAINRLRHPRRKK